MTTKLTELVMTGEAARFAISAVAPERTRVAAEPRSSPDALTVGLEAPSWSGVPPPAPPRARHVDEPERRSRTCFSSG